MKTSRKTDYAVHALMILTRNEADELSVKELAEIENVSSSYLAKVMQKLSAAGIVSSAEGKKGGYTLANDAENITLAQIMELFEAKDNVFECVDDIHGCPIKDRCKIHRVFGKAYQKMLAELEQTTIKDIINPENKIKKGFDLMNKPKIEIYTKTWCPYCRRAKAMLKSLGLDYTDYDITDNEDLQQEMVERSGKKTIPQIFINDQKIGGYDDLIELVSSGGLDDLIEFERPNCSEKDWDLAVIGAGPAGMTAAVYAARKGLKVLMVARDIGGQVLETDTIDNYLPEYGTSGPALMQNFLKHLRNYQIDTLFGEEITEITPQEKKHILLTKSGKEIKTQAVLIAAGTKKRKLGVPGEHQLKDKGVSYCATCDGYIYENQPVAVVGGGNSGLEAALDMSKIATEVYLVIRGEQLSGDKNLQDKVNKSEKIEVCKSYQTTEIKGDQKVESIRIKNLNTGKERELNVNAIFIEIGLIPNTGFICEDLEINQGNEIIIDENNQTSVEGIFAAGDVTDIKDKQIIVSAAEGAKAALRANEYLS